MNEAQRTALSKFLALLLRHRAADYNLTLDPEGWVPLDALLGAINASPGWDWVRVEHIEEVIALQTKRRYEIDDDEIRAIYGHSLAAAINYPEIVPPETLLHGTARRFVAAIRREGLRPMRRQYVHLTDDPAVAQLTGRRRDAQPAILVIAAAHAHADGITFYQADGGVFLARHIPPAYITFEEASHGRRPDPM